MEVIIVDSTIAQLNENQMEELKKLETELGVVLVAYEK